MTAIIKVESYFTTSLLSQRTYVKGNNVKISIERDRYSMLALVDDVGENFNWGPNQYISFWKLGDVSTQSKVEITTDSQLLDWLDKGNQHGVVNIHAIVNDFGGPLQVEPSPTKRRCHPSVRYSIPCTPPLFTDLLVDATPLTLPESYNHLENSIQPVPSTQNESTTHPESTSHPDDEATSPIKKSAKKVVKKCAKRRSQADDDDEEVRDDEKEENEEEEPQLCPNCDPLEVDSESSYDSDAAASSDSEYDCDDLDDQIHDDDDNDSDLEHVFAYDFDNPCIDEGEVFADTTTCKEAVTHHAIIHDYSFETEKKDKHRFRAFCKKKEQGCKWRFHASTSKKYYGCKVNLC